MAASKWGPFPPTSATPLPPIGLPMEWGSQQGGEKGLIAPGALAGEGLSVPYAPTYRWSACLAAAPPQLRGFGCFYEMQGWPLA